MCSSKKIESSIIAECTINDRTFVITVDKKIFERTKGEYIECHEKDIDIDILRKYIKPPKSLDIDN